MDENKETDIRQTRKALADAKSELAFLDVYVGALQRKLSDADRRRLCENDDRYVNARKNAKRGVAVTSVVCICVFCMIAVSVYVGINCGRPIGAEIAVPFAVGVLSGGVAGLTAYLIGRKKLLTTAAQIVDEYKNELAERRAACSKLIEARKAEIRDLETELGES